MTDEPLSDEQKAAVDAFYHREAPRLAEALKALPWTGGRERRDALAAIAEAQRTADGALDKTTFDAILKWGIWTRIDPVSDSDRRHDA
jgi:hypothetical protein